MLKEHVDISLVARARSEKMIFYSQNSRDKAHLCRLNRSLGSHADMRCYMWFDYTNSAICVMSNPN